MFPGPMEHLKSHAIAFIAGSLTIIATNLYSKYLASRQMPKT